MAQKTHDTFIVHLNHEEMFTAVSPEQCQRLVKAMFKLARTGEIEDMSDDVILNIFFKQIASFMVSNAVHYEDVRSKRKEAAQKKWEDYKRLKAEEAKRNGQPIVETEEIDDLRSIFGEQF